MKTFIFCLSFFIISLSTIYCQGNDELAQFFKEKGFDNTDELTREQFIDLTDYLLTKTTDNIESEKIGFRKFIPKYVQHVPERFPKDDISKYISTETLSKIMHDFIDEKYPGKEGLEMKAQLNAMTERQRKINTEEKKPDL